MLIYYAPSNKGGHVALLLSVCRSVGRYVGRSIHQQFSFIFYAEDDYIKMKIGKQVIHDNM